MSTQRNDDLDFEKMVTENIVNADRGKMTAAEEATGARLKEMNKKLPSWNLEPPFTYIK